MFKKIFIKIGFITIKIFKKLTLKNKNNKNKEKNDYKIINEILKANKNKKRTINRGFIIFPIIFIILLTITKNLETTLKVVIILILIELFKETLPKMKEKQRKKEIMAEFPFALRQISTQLKAGIGLYDSMKSIAEGDYGELSGEFQITLNEIQYESDFVKSFENLSERCGLESMDKFCGQIIRTLNNGGNLADTLNVLANEYSHNVKVKYREYSEKLNAIMLLYMFIAVLLPVILFVLIIAATTVMGQIIEAEMLIILYYFFFPMVIVFMIILIKELEPGIG